MFTRKFLMTTTGKTRFDLLLLDEKEDYVSDFVGFMHECPLQARHVLMKSERVGSGAGEEGEAVHFGRVASPAGGALGNQSARHKRVASKNTNVFWERGHLCKAFAKRAPRKDGVKKYKRILGARPPL